MRVIESFENEDGSRCVDVFVRADGSYGFESYRRDVEDRNGWFAVGGFARHRFEDAGAALEAAAAAIDRLAVKMNRPG